MYLISRSLLLYSSLLIGSALLLSGCASLNSTAGGLVRADTDVSLTFVAESDSNPDDNGKPSPVFVRIYELKSPKLFERADFIDLYERDEEILGADLLNKQVLKRLLPGEERKERFKKLAEDAEYVGLFAEFLRYEEAKFKLIVPVARNNLFSNKAKVVISGNSITLED